MVNSPGSLRTEGCLGCGLSSAETRQVSGSPGKLATLTRGLMHWAPLQREQWACFPPVGLERILCRPSACPVVTGTCWVWLQVVPLTPTMWTGTTIEERWTFYPQIPGSYHWAHLGSWNVTFALGDDRKDPFPFHQSSSFHYNLKSAHYNCKSEHSLSLSYGFIHSVCESVFLKLQENWDMWKTLITLIWMISTRKNVIHVFIIHSNIIMLLLCRDY